MANKASLAFPHNFTITFPFAWSVIQLMGYEFLYKDEKDRRLNGIVEYGSCNLPKNRNVIVHKFLEGTTDQYLWFVDSDIQFAPSYLEMMCAKAEEIDADILACPYFLGDGSITFYSELEPGHYTSYGTLKHNEVYELDAAGTGLMLIHRRVLVGMKDIFTGHYRVNGEDIPASWFRYDQVGGIVGSDDMTFCQRAKKQGYRIWGWAECIPEHWKLQPLHPQVERVEEPEEDEPEMEEPRIVIP